MPELPEVETIRRDLAKVLIGKKITAIEIINKSPVKDGAERFKKILLNKKIKQIERIGKLMMFDLTDGQRRSESTPRGGGNFLLVHLKMTGQLIYRHGHTVIEGGHNLPVFKENDLPTKYTWVAWKFNDGSDLYFNDMRKFGYLKIVDKKAKEKIVAKYGIEPLTKNFTLTNFKKVLAKRKTSIKSVLLNQALVAGIGNIYADEICFAAGLRPDSSVAKLAEAEIKKVFIASSAIIKKAIEHKGTTFKDYVNAHGGKGNFSDYLKVYKRVGKKCLRCKEGVITSKKIAGRTSHYCPVCQKVIN
ncbi:MAG TPA: bifunctional DNA-formamidopyrimidine glycosylase/DNA-(apurinic or apyrimidinic site) lyase [Candidatus Udaeobacter sp.]|nr:bifunctional DNA-formamidopyrimidine glycosylase/DNA-(apurinic or apyrimidinic site) lyase [Candidatus Udaeobacter sp.]